MPRYEFARAARAGLLDELIAAGFAPTTPVEMDDARCWVTCEEGEWGRAAAVVAAHDAAAIDAREVQSRADDDADRAALRAAVATLLADAARLEDALQVLTVPQIRAGQGRTNRALAALVRALARRGL